MNKNKHHIEYIWCLFVIVRCTVQLIQIVELINKFY